MANPTPPHFPFHFRLVASLALCFYLVPASLHQTVMLCKPISLVKWLKHLLLSQISVTTALFAVMTTSVPKGVILNKRCLQYEISPKIVFLSFCVLFFSLFIFCLVILYYQSTHSNPSAQKNLFSFTQTYLCVKQTDVSALTNFRHWRLFKKRLLHRNDNLILQDW